MMIFVTFVSMKHSDIQPGDVEAEINDC